MKQLFFLLVFWALGLDLSAQLSVNYYIKKPVEALYLKNDTTLLDLGDEKIYILTKDTITITLPDPTDTTQSEMSFTLFCIDSITVVNFNYPIWFAYKGSDRNTFSFSASVVQSGMAMWFFERKKYTYKTIRRINGRYEVVLEDLHFD
jgi:hypothetical protein